MREGVPDVPVSHATIDAEGRLIAADPAIMALNDHVGGSIGAAFAVPPLATAARLARRLGVIVSRQVMVADADANLDLWVRAQREGDAVRLVVSGWREVRLPAEPNVSGHAFERVDADLRWETDAALRLTYVSIAAGKRLGIDALGELGKPVTSLFAFDEDMDGQLPILDALARRQPLTGQAARVRTTGQAVVLSATPRPADGMAFAGLLGTARIAEVEAAAAATTLSEDFAAGLDKALRAPLARIIATADTINAAAEGPVQQDYADYAGDIAHAGRHLLGLVDDLVDLQAVERPDFVLPSEAIDLADVARRAAGLLSVRASNAGVAIARPLPAVSVPARGDFRRALQVMVNLIGNAIRYSPDGAVVTVTVADDGPRVVAVVDDQGKGINRDDQARIFEKFERVDTSEPGGNGLGLYIARRLARAMGGDLTVQSAPGEGARFTLALPADAPGDKDQHQA